MKTKDFEGYLKKRLSEDSIKKINEEAESDFFVDRLLLMIGYSAGIIEDLKPFANEKSLKNINWFFKAIEEVVYKKKPLPTFLGSE